jgi:hypothetical protein
MTSPSNDLIPLTEESPGTDEHQLSSRLDGLSCKNCGGALEVELGLRVISCSFCRTKYLVVDQRGARNFAVEPKIEDSRVRDLVAGWMAKGWNKAPQLREESQLGHSFLCFIPFFRIQADCLGFALGTERRRRTVGSGKNRRVQTYEVDVERSVERNFDRTYPAINVAEWGVRRVDLRGDPLVPFRPNTLGRLGMVFPVTASAAEVREMALRKFKQEADPERGLHRVRFRFLQTVREMFSVVYYPIWITRYTFHGRSYQVLIDAEDGSMAYGKAPGNDLYRAIMLVGSQAVGIFAASTLLQVWSGGIEALAIVGAATAGLLYWGWKKYRFGGVVIEGTGATSK